MCTVDCSAAVWESNLFVTISCFPLEALRWCRTARKQLQNRRVSRIHRQKNLLFQRDFQLFYIRKSWPRNTASLPSAIPLIEVGVQAYIAYQRMPSLFSIHSATGHQYKFQVECLSTTLDSVVSFILEYRMRCSWIKRNKLAPNQNLTSEKAKIDRKFKKIAYPSGWHHG